MNEYLTLEEERGRPYGVLTCFVPTSAKQHYVRAAKMKRGRTVSGYIREALDLLINVEERLLPRTEVLTSEYATDEYLNAHYRPLGKGSHDPTSLVEERETQRKADKEEKAISATSTWKPGDPNPILVFIEGKDRQRSTKISRQ